MRALVAILSSKICLLKNLQASLVYVYFISLFFLHFPIKMSGKMISVIDNIDDIDLCCYIMSSVESQNGVNAVKRCSLQNQKGTIAVQSLWQQHPSGSQGNILEQH